MSQSYLHTAKSINRKIAQKEIPSISVITETNIDEKMEESKGSTRRFLHHANNFTKAQPKIMIESIVEDNSTLQGIGKDDFPNQIQYIRPKIRDASNPKFNFDGDFLAKVSSVESKELYNKTL